VLEGKVRFGGQKVREIGINEFAEIAFVSRRPSAAIAKINYDASSRIQLAIAITEPLNYSHPSSVCVSVQFAGGKCMSAILDVILAKRGVYGQREDCKDSDGQSN
jgi:hypothetical protein